MTYVIVINLDYDNNDEDYCHELWQHISTGMLEAGFHCDGRNFSINATQEEAVRQAREVLASLENMLSFEKKDIYQVMKQCYGYHMDTVTNLLLPPSDSIEVHTGIIDDK